MRIGRRLVSDFLSRVVAQARIRSKKGSGARSLMISLSNIVVG